MRPNYKQWREQESIRRISDEEAVKRWNILNQRIIRERFDVPLNINTSPSVGGVLRNDINFNDFNDDFNDDFS